jgi:hypothetical protein
VIAGLRADGRALVAASLEHAIPVAVSPRGDVTLELDAPNEMYAQGIANAAPDILAEIGTLFSGAARLLVQTSQRTAPAEAPRRLTEESVRAERLAMLRRRDPSLDAVVDVLDLDLCE